MMKFIYDHVCVLHANEWRQERENYGYFKWSEDEIKTAELNSDGFIGEKYGIKCYILKKIKNAASHKGDAV